MWTKKIFFGIGCIILAAALNNCGSSNTKSTGEYKKEVDAWHKMRIKSLTQDDSWLSLAGLYWLDQGSNSFGSDSANAVIFPPKAPARMGTLNLKNSTVSVSVASSVSVTSDSASVQNRVLKPDVSGNPTILHNGSLSWYVIKRGDRWGVRLKDGKNEALKHFKGIDRYPVQKRWRVEATFSAYDSVQTIEIPTILGEPAAVKIPGRLDFKIKGQSYTILPIHESSDSDEWFIVFGDKTNGEETYGGGRFIYVTKAGDDHKTYIDFNKAYNPPCAFTAFATCPLPPPENRLNVAIKAGEKSYGKHH